ncbi:MAG: GNAT family N-acetyltransferase [Acidimicrobiales bacterium]
MSLSSTGDSVTVELVSPASRPILENLLQLYMHDLSEFRGSVPNQRGRFGGDGRYASYVSDPDRCAYIVRHLNQPSGFALVRGLSEDRRVVGGFFIVRSLRRHGLGRDAALALLRRHPGPWEIAFQEENPRAATFWRGVASDLLGDDWSEERRPVPNKAHLPEDVWITMDSRAL